jgi:MFS family permease
VIASRLFTSPPQRQHRPDLDLIPRAKVVNYSLSNTLLQPTAKMGLLDKIEDRPTPQQVYNWRVYFSASIAAFAAVMIGYDSAFIGGTIALPSFREEFGLDKLAPKDVNFLSANIVSTYQAGCFFGAILGYPLGQLWGRKRGLMIAGAVFILGAGMMLGATAERGLGLIYGGRVIAGFGIGAASNLTPIYIAELSPPAIRGRLVGLYELGWQVGGLVGFWINYGKYPPG